MCTCFEDVNAKLAENGQELPDAFSIGNGTLTRHLAIPLIRKDTSKPETRRSKPRTIVASFCPWCGEKWRD